MFQMWTMIRTTTFTCFTTPSTVVHGSTMVSIPTWNRNYIPHWDANRARKDPMSGETSHIFNIEKYFFNIDNYWCKIRFLLRRRQKIDVKFLRMLNGPECYFRTVWLQDTYIDSRVRPWNTVEVLSWCFTSFI